jgi:uncharacterized protein YbjT (DUF2867 family)
VFCAGQVGAARNLRGFADILPGMNQLVTGATGFVGSVLIGRLLDDGHEVRAFARNPLRVLAGVPVVAGDVVTGAGLDEALEGVDVAYYLIHSMESAPDSAAFDERERRSAENFAAAASRAGVRRIVYLGGLVPQLKAPSPHLLSRLDVERVLMEAAPEVAALRASIVIGARSRSFRFLVRLVERLPVMAIPAWHHYRTQPIDARDMLELVVRAGCSDAIDRPLSLDIAGPTILSYGELIERIRDHMLLLRPAIRLPLTMTPVASVVAAAIAGEDVGLIGPLMGSLTTDLIPRNMDAVKLLDVRLHSFDAAVERALREWEDVEALAAR